jgi:capsular exopolysaccharide synthesis family protein
MSPVHHLTRTARGGAARANQGGLDVHALRRAFARRWPLAITVGLLLAGVGFCALYFLLPQPPATATAMLHLDPNVQRLVFDLGERPITPAIFQSTQTALASSRIVLGIALRSLSMANQVNLAMFNDQDPLEYLEQRVKVSFVGSPEIMNISLSGMDHYEDMAVIVNAIVQAYKDEFADKDTIRRRDKLNKLTVFVSEYESALKFARNSLKIQQEAVGPGGDKMTIALRDDAIKTEIAHMTRDLHKFKRDVGDVEFQIKELDQGFVQEADLSKVTVAVEKDLILKEFEKQKQTLEILLEETRNRAAKGDDEPKVIELKRKLEANIREARKYRMRLRASLEEGLQANANANGKSKRDSLVFRKTYLEGLVNTLELQIAALREELKGFVKNAIKLIDGQRDIDDREETLSRMKRQIDSLKVELEGLTRVRAVQEAVVRRIRDMPRRLGISSGAAFGLFLLGAFAVTFLEYRAHRLGSTGELVNELGLSVIGTVPAYLKGMPQNQEGVAYSDRRLVDSVDAARILLLHIAQTGSLKTVMVASAVSGEGKTSLSGHLAASLARAGRRTLLIDADLRKPALHELFAVPDVPGLSEVLRGDVPVSQAVQGTTVPNLFLLTAGQSDDIVFEALARDAAGPIFRVLRQEFDFILVDSSPIMLVPEGLLVAQQADGVLFSVMENVSRLPLVKAACQRLAMVGIPILGAVVSAAREASAYGYRYAYSVTRRAANQAAS